MGYWEKESFFCNLSYIQGIQECHVLKLEVLFGTAGVEYFEVG